MFNAPTRKRNNNETLNFLKHNIQIYKRSPETPLQRLVI